ncbi:uncharacterized protein METZ01_LOCUS180153, partial [marine metagenome]
MRHLFRISIVFSILIAFIFGQDKPKSILPGPERAEGDGPFKRLVIRGATVIDGSGA